ncbi:DNA mismatch repair protein MutT [Microtetraspora sp. NBRC 13810]|nr:DNA mismatch repair protein MutT [Microtetraspora sp. NBRC 13810]
MRPSARVLLADQDDRILLFRGSDGTWFTPGGGLDPGEPVEVAAARELREETGYLVTPENLGRVVAVGAGHWRGGWDGLLYYSVESYFFLRVTGFTVDTSGFTDHERRDIGEHRWWSVADLRTTGENVVPWGLVGLLERLHAGQPPADPVRLPWHHPEFAHLAAPEPH